MDESIAFLNTGPGASRSYRQMTGNVRPKVRGAEHTGDANRHMSRRAPHMCICFDSCCQDFDYGCKCKACPCHNGGPTHDEAHELHNKARENERTKLDAVYASNSRTEIQEAHTKAGNG